MSYIWSVDNAVQNGTPAIPKPGRRIVIFRIAALLLLTQWNPYAAGFVIWQVHEPYSYGYQIPALEFPSFPKISEFPFLSVLAFLVPMKSRVHLADNYLENT